VELLGPASFCVLNGEVPYSGYEAARVNQMIEDISYNNAKQYFQF